MAEVVAIMAMRPLVSMLMSKVSSSLLDQYKVMEGMEDQHKILKRKLPAILDVIIDAEKQAVEHRDGAKAWLQELKTVAYQANEVFDEFKYEALRREAKKKGHYKELGFDVVKLFPTHNRIVFRYKMGRRLCQILRTIDVLIAEMQVFGFKYQPQPQVSKQGRQTDFVIIDPHEVASRSRHKDKKNIVDILLGQASNAHPAVVPIVGMGGLGKTTLVQLIYNEPKIQKHFQLLLWVCVSDTFDVNSLAKCIVEASPKKNDDTDKPPLDRLQKLVSGQRYLLVLDDVWNKEVHKWERLKACLQHGGIGSAVLTTTRDKQVAEIMGADKPYCLKVLEDTFIKEIIEARAFTPDKEKPAALVKMVDEIVKRCSGSPLAATALGSLLRTKTSVKEWKAVSCSSSICTEETGILPILKLSYNNLPPHMKQCFAFCAVFPKDYRIHVEKLILLWIANGFIPEDKEDSLETVGKRIFNELASGSFFLDIEESENFRGYPSTTCKIHDLMHDIAMFVMEKECVFACEESSETEWLPDTARHLFLSCHKAEDILNISMEKRSPAIQTLLCDSFMRNSLQHLSKYNSLTALKLQMQGELFFLKPKYLHHLRYLDLSESKIKSLPEDISILYNLQTLDLSYCYLLDRLPRHMKYMTSLRHLYTPGCHYLKSMPPELGKLTKLQTLTHFVAGATSLDCSDVAELEHLNLCGRLELCQIENIAIEAQAKVANLGNKKDLRGLTLRWTSVCDSEVLSNFEPHDGLQVLNIYSYGGKFMGMLQNMVEIRLSKCERLQFLFRCGTSFTFPNLKELTLEDLLDFERWSELNEQITFPLLEKLFIRHCRKLIALPEAPLLLEQFSGGMLVRSAFPALKVLKMNDLVSFHIWDAAVEGHEILFPLLEELSIEKCPKLIALPEAPLLQESCIGGGYRLVRSSFPALKVLSLENLESFHRWDAAVEGHEILFPLLEELSILECPKLIALPEAPLLQEPCIGGYRLVHPPFPLLENFFNRYCTKVIALPEEPLRQEPCIGSYRSAFPALKVLKLSILESLQRWDAAVDAEIILFPQLEKLSVFGCPKLIDLPEAPKLGVLETWGVDKIEFLHCISKYLPSVTRLMVHQEDMEIKLDAGCTLTKPADSKEKFYQKSPFAVMELRCCKLFFGSGGLETWDYFVLVGYLKIDRCDVLVHWPEEVFRGLVSLKRLAIENCSNLTGYTLEPSTSERNKHLPGLEVLELKHCASLVEIFNVPASLKRMEILRCQKVESIYSKQQQSMSEFVQGSSCTEAILPTAVSELSSRPMNHFCPCLEYLGLAMCDSLSAVLYLPPSLKTLVITQCTSIQVVSCQLDGLQKPQVAAAAREHSLPPYLEYLLLSSCDGMLGGVLRLPTSLKNLSIGYNSGFKSLESLSGEPPSLETLYLDNCSTLASLLNEPQAYSYLEDLCIKGCPAIKKLPRCLQQQLGSINSTELDAQYEVTAFKRRHGRKYRDWSGCGGSDRH